MQEDKTYLITDISVKIIHDREFYWNKEREMHPVRKFDEIEPIGVSESHTIQARRFLINGSVLMLAITPPLDKFLGYPFERIEYLDKCLKEMDEKFEKQQKQSSAYLEKLGNCLKEIEKIKSMPFFRRLKYLFIGRF